jgi:DNA-binding NarL/FixJ family response regulator
MEEVPFVQVLVVDDQAPFRAAARNVVRVTPGFELVGEAETGEEGVAMASALHPDLVLMDINMPGINGVEATRQVVDAFPDIVVFLCSTYSLDDLPPDAVGSGAVAYVNKEAMGPAVLRRLWATRAEPREGLATA